MGSLELENRSRYSKIIFLDDKIILYKKNKEIVIPTDCIEYIEYAKLSLFNYLWNLPGFLGGPCPGRLEIHLNKKIGKTRLYIVKIKSDEIYKLPKFYRVRMGISSYLDPD